MRVQTCRHAVCRPRNIGHSGLASNALDPSKGGHLSASLGGGGVPPVSNTNFEEQEPFACDVPVGNQIHLYAVHVDSLNGIVTPESFDNDVGVDNPNGRVVLAKINGSASVDLLTKKIEGQAMRPLNGVIDLRTLSGDISLAIPANTSAAFTATVSVVSIGVSNLVLQSEVNTATSWSGTLGGGRGLISLDASQVGDISLSDV